MALPTVFFSSPGILGGHLQRIFQTYFGQNKCAKASCVSSIVASLDESATPFLSGGGFFHFQRDTTLSFPHTYEELMVFVCFFSELEKNIGNRVWSSNFQILNITPCFIYEKLSLFCQFIYNWYTQNPRNQLPVLPPPLYSPFQAHLRSPLYREFQRKRKGGRKRRMQKRQVTK